MKNPVVREMESELLLSKMGTVLKHYGVSILDDAPGVGSGRYPLGSGENPGQHRSGDLLTRIEALQKKGYSDAQIAEELGIIGRSGKPSSGRVRALKDILKYERRSAEFAEATKMREQGMSYQAIANKLGYKNESSVRNILNEDVILRRSKAITTAEYLKKEIGESGMLDVGRGTERYLGVSSTKLNEALEILQAEGYKVYGGGIKQATNPQQQTNQLVLCTPDKEHKDIYKYDEVKYLKDPDTRQYSLQNDGEQIRKAFEYPSSISSDRIDIVYGDKGGSAKDGLVEIRPGVKDLDLGGSHYCQVRILVDGTHYIKGMALYADDLPEGKDIRFNTNKLEGTPLLGDKKSGTILKPIVKDDPDNPFGSSIKPVVEGGQTYYDDPKGKFIDPVTGKRQSLNAINKRSDEGDWGGWSDNLPSQFLAKQTKQLAEKQLNLAKQDKIDELKDIMELNNPTIRKNLLYAFADNCDAASVHLKAAALPRQKYQVLLPLKDIKDTEVYAPNYRDGETVALVRYPHGGIFEIPILTVNNKNKEGKKVIGPNAKDAVGISMKVAEQLSGADFDGDTVQVIPCNNGPGSVKISSKKALEGLKGFDPKLSYPERPGMKVMKNTQTEMGIISNLIMDMTLKGASDDELARAVRHSMVVIDAEKHHLDYKRSEVDNDIKGLKRRYQKKVNPETGEETFGGASTLISRAKGERTVDKRVGSRRIDPETGKVYWKTAPDNKLYYQDIKKTGKAYRDLVANTPGWKNMTAKEQRKILWDAVDRGVLETVTKKRTQASTNMAETDDARTLISDYNTPIERLYADYANSMKSMANNARKTAMATPSLKYDRQAEKRYSSEVDSLNAKLVASEKNAVRERQATRIANVKISEKRETLERAGFTKKEIDKELKTYRQRKMEEARIQTGAHRTPIDITPKEWEAIQAGAISETKLQKILNHTDTDKIKELATPRKTNELSAWKISKIKAMSTQDYTIEQIAKSLGVSPSTVSKYM